MGRRKKPDKISHMSTAAIQLGMSYGNYVAKYFPAVTESARPSIGTKHICAYCGAEFIQYDQRLRKYCCEEHRIAANSQIKRDRKMASGGAKEIRKKKEEPPERFCIICGSRITEKGRSKYCCRLCSSQAQSERVSARYRMKKEVCAHELEI